MAENLNKTVSCPEVFKNNLHTRLGIVKEATTGEIEILYLIAAFSSSASIVPAKTAD